jgi:hypothetical protein
VSAPASAPPEPVDLGDGRQAADPMPAPVRRFPQRLVDGALVAVVVGVGFALFQPDWFDNQNGLDPFFYTGMSLNLSDSIDYGAEAHYFLSRWTLYGPELLAARVLGPTVGFVTTRLMLLALCRLGVALLRPGLLDQLAALGFVLGGPVLDYVDDTVAPSMRVHVAPMSVRKGGTAGPPS